MKALSIALAVLLPIALLSTTYIYTLYPLLGGCFFPTPPRPPGSAIPPRMNQRPMATSVEDLMRDPQSDVWEPPPPWPRAPLRLLALADPQLEGNTAVSSSGGPLAALRKRLDLLGNDYFLRHVVRVMGWWGRPTHVVVLGDLLGSQWVDDGEFEARAARYWARAFGGYGKVDAGQPARTSWEKSVISVAGNHDVGYAGDISTREVERFERAFGPVNWAVELGLDRRERTRHRLVNPAQVKEDAPRLSLVVLNSMNLDGPAKDGALADKTAAFLEGEVGKAQARRGKDATVLLTHVPLYKPEGVCVDGPYTTYWPEGEGGGIREQNHLSEESSRKVLDGLFGQDGDGYRKGVVLDGHDHYGCDVLHSSRPGAELQQKQDDAAVEQADEEAKEAAVAAAPRRVWTAERYAQPKRGDTVYANTTAGVREVTVRSMMGQYGGAAGMLSGWWDDRSDEWRFEYKECRFGTQTTWWAVHVLDVVVAVLLVTLVPGMVRGFFEEDAEWEARVAAEKAKKTQ